MEPIKCFVVVVVVGRGMGVYWVLNFEFLEYLFTKLSNLDW